MTATVAMAGIVAVFVQVVDPPWMVAVPILGWCAVFVVLNILDTSTDRSRILDVLTRRDAMGLYTRAMKGSFALFDRMMAPDEHTGAPPRGRVARFSFYWEFNVPAGTVFARPAFAWPVADTALKLAIIYPLFALLVQWAWTGQATGIAGISVLEAEERLWPRLATTCPLAAFIIAKIVAAATRRPAWERAAAWLYFVAIAVAGAFAVTVAVTVAVTGAVAIAGAVGWGVWRGRGLFSYAGLVALILSLITTLLILAPTLDVPPEFRLLIFVFALLPVLNAIFDYLSYGTTLSLLDKGHDGEGPTRRVALWAVADIVMAFVYLVALGLTLTLVVHVINTASGVPMLDLPQVFADLRDPDLRGGYTWLILACLTTLVPTLFHLGIAALAATAWWGPRDRLRAWIEAEGQLTTLAATALAAACAVATLAVMLALLAGIASLGLGLFGDMGVAPFGIEAIGLLVLDCVEALARVSGVL